EGGNGPAGSNPAPDENMKQITIRVDPDLLAAISERQSVAIVAISERQSMAIVKQPRRTFAGERQAEAFIAAPRIACKLLKQRETKNRRREGTAPPAQNRRPDENMKQITIRVDPDLLAAISERQSVAIVKQPRRTFAG